jgi:hypothetical protein
MQKISACYFLLQQQNHVQPVPIISAAAEVTSATKSSAFWLVLEKNPVRNVAERRYRLLQILQPTSSQSFPVEAEKTHEETELQL